ncbi:MAG: choice-of-anchor Q domain-containing protein, partial [Verrucomicrobiota bacterium]
TGSILTIMPGTRIYFHKDAWLAVSFQSTLKIPGTLDHPVRFQGDRMDPFYKDLPGQWGGIYLDRGSRENEMNYVVLKNGIFGISADSLGAPGTPMLTLSNSVIQNMTSDGIYAYGSSIKSWNCVIGDCGGSSVDVEYGGSYDFSQLTIGNYWSTSVRHQPALYLSNYTYGPAGAKVSNTLSKASFGNVIVYGSSDDEIVLDSVAGAAFTCTFDHALLKTKLKTSYTARYINCITNKDPRYVNVIKFDYRIDSISPAINQGAATPYPTDILGNTRDVQPDLGAYEYVKKN